MNDDGVCVKECKDGYIGFNKKCIKCGSDCIKCQPHNTLYCTVCPFGKILCEGKCLSQLSAGYYEKGDYVENTDFAIRGAAGSRYVLKGWLRLTTGSDHVLNVDWLEDRIFTGS